MSTRPFPQNLAPHVLSLVRIVICYLLLLCLSVAGPGPWSVDALRSRGSTAQGIGGR